MLLLLYNLRYMLCSSVVVPWVNEASSTSRCHIPEELQVVGEVEQLALVHHGAQDRCRRQTRLEDDQKEEEEEEEHGREREKGGRKAPKDHCALQRFSTFLILP